VRFARRGWLGRTGWSIAAQTPDEWLEREARPGKKAVVLHRRTNDPDRMLAGFVGGGGSWQLHSTDGHRTDVWEATWEVGNREAADKRIWRVRYAPVSENLAFVPPIQRSPTEIIPALNQALSDVLAFSEQHQIAYFDSCFRKATECLSSGDPFALVHHQDLAPEALLSLPAQQVLAACQAAWVFGGMGSWNDMGFEGPEQARYEKLSEALFTLLNEAIQSATNSAADFAQSS
jgi:hypothetical protein